MVRIRHLKIPQTKYSSSWDKWKQYLFGKIVKNIELRIIDMHIRWQASVHLTLYAHAMGVHNSVWVVLMNNDTHHENVSDLICLEDDGTLLSNCGANTTSPLAGGLYVRDCSLVTTDASGKQMFEKAEQQVPKPCLEMSTSSSSSLV